MILVLDEFKQNKKKKKKQKRGLFNFVRVLYCRFYVNFHETLSMSQTFLNYIVYLILYDYIIVIPQSDEDFYISDIILYNCSLLVLHILLPYIITAINILHKFFVCLLALKRSLDWLYFFTLLSYLVTCLCVTTYVRYYS